MGLRFLGKFRFFSKFPGSTATTGVLFSKESGIGWLPAGAPLPDPPDMHFAAFAREDHRVALQAVNGLFVRRTIWDGEEILDAQAATADAAEWFPPGFLDTTSRTPRIWSTADGRVVWSLLYAVRVSLPGEAPKVPWLWYVERVTPPIEKIVEQRSAQGLDLQWLDLSGKNFSGFDFRGTRLEHAVLAGTVFDGARLDGARLSGAVLTGTFFRNKATLQGAEIIGTHLERVDLTGGADLARAVFRGSTFKACHLEGAILHGTDFGKTTFDVETRLGSAPNFGRALDQRTRFAGATLPHRSLGKDWRFLDLAGATFTDFTPGPSAQKVDLQKLQAEQAILTGLTLSDSDLTDAVLRKADLTGTHLEGTVLTCADFSDAILTRAILRGATAHARAKGTTKFDAARLYATHLTNLSFEKCSFAGAYGGESGEERVAFFTGSVFTQVDFTGAILSGADLTLVVMSNCTLKGARLEDARLGLSFLGEAHFEEAHLEGADFVRSCLVGAHLQGAHLVDMTSGRLRSASFIEAWLHGADFSDTSLDKVDLKGAFVTFNTEPKDLTVWIPRAPGQPNRDRQIRYGATRLSPESTGRDTVCPDGHEGPCARQNLELPVPDNWQYDGHQTTGGIAMPEGRPTEKRRYHFDLSRGPAGHTYHLTACLRRHELVPHDTASLRAAAAGSARLAGIPAERLTHYADIELPSDAVALLMVSRPEMRDLHEIDRPVALGLHIPEASTRHLGASAGAADYKNAQETAKSLLFKHAGLVALDVVNHRAAYVRDVIIANAEGLSILVDKIDDLGEEWSSMVAQSDENGRPLYYETGERKGQRVYAMVLHDEVAALLTVPLQSALRKLRDDPKLEGSMWWALPGRVSPHVTGQTLSTEPRLQGDSPQWSYRNDTPRYGLELTKPAEVHPQPGDVWRASGVWMNDDPSRPLADDVIADLAAGRIEARVLRDGNTVGFLRGKLELAVGDRGKKVVFQSVDGGEGRAEAILGLGTHGLTYEATAWDLKGPSSLKFWRMPLSLHARPLINQRGLNRLSMEIKNWVPRHLSTYVQFVDPAGRAFDPKDEWSERLPEAARKLLQPDATKKWLGVLGPEVALFSVPIEPAVEKIELTVPKNAATVRLLLGGLGHGQDFDPSVCAAGIALTAVVEMVVPIAFLIAGISADKIKVVKEFFEETDNVVALAAVLGPLYVAESVTQAILIDQDPIPVLARTAEMLLPKLVHEVLLKILGAALAEAAFINAVPIVKLIFTLISAGVTISGLIQTVVSIFNSPFVFDIELKRTMGLRATLYPDSRTGSFPDLATELRTYLVYDDEANGRVHEQKVNWGAAITKPHVVELADVPVGGRLKLVALFYSENGWQAGQGESAWYNAQPDNDKKVLEIGRVDTTTNEVPLTVDTQYRHTLKLGFDGGYRWKESPTPPPEVDLSRSDGKKQLRSLDHITMNGPAARLGYVWQATGLGLPLDGGPPSDDFARAIRSVKIFRDQDTDSRSLEASWSRETGLSFDLPGAPDGLHFLVEGSAGTFDPDTNRRGGFHLRRLDLGKPFTLPTRSWGRFTFPPASVAVHPGGAVVGISREDPKLGILRLPASPVDDEKAPCALLLSGPGTADGMLGDPVAVATALDGRILVLEAGNLRVQAFDLMANPVYSFAGKRCWFKLDKADHRTTRVLDLAVEPKGHVYVLSYEDHGGKLTANDFHLDIYRPDGTFLARTNAVNVGKICVNLVRNLYTLNFEMILGEKGRPEPSVSLWLPSPPRGV